MEYVINTYTRMSFSENKGRKIDIKIEKPIKATTSGIQVDVINLPSTGAPEALVTRIQALSFNELPARYIQSHSGFFFPKVWQDGKKLKVGTKFTLLEEGRVYKQSYIREALLYIELAGRHLAAVNEEKKLYLAENCFTTFKDGVFKRRASLPGNKKEQRADYDRPY